MGRGGWFTIGYVVLVVGLVGYVAGLAGFAGTGLLGAAGSSPLRNVLELVYFASNPLVVAVGGLALATAQRQFKEAENARLAGIYSGIVAELNSKEMTESRLALAGLGQRFRKTRRQAAEFPFFVHEEIDFLRRTPENLPRYHVYIKIVFFMENVGLLIRRSYVDAEDVSLLMGAAIRTTAQAFEHHIQQRRDEVNDPKLFEHLTECVKIIDRVSKPGAGKRRLLNAEDF